MGSKSIVPLLQYPKGEKEASASSDGDFVGRLAWRWRGGSPSNRRTAVYRLGLCPRSRVCSPSVDGRARFGRVVVALRRVCSGGVGEAKASTPPWNKVLRPLLRPVVALLRCPR